MAYRLRLSLAGDLFQDCFEEKARNVCHALLPFLPTVRLASEEELGVSERDEEVSASREKKMELTLV